jgi:ABC-2 type transport system permease protein
MIAALVGRSFARARGVLGGAALLLVLFQLALVLQAASYDQERMFETLGRMTPAFIQRWFGDTITALASFGGIIAFGYFHPVVVLLVALVTAFVASEPAGDVEAGHVDLLLAGPVARHWIMTRSGILLVLSPVLLAMAMMTATFTTAALVAPSDARGPSFSSIATLAAHLVAVAWTFGALALLLASMARRRASAFAPAALTTVALYFLNVLAASWAPARAADVVSPFHYFQGTRILAGISDPGRDLFILGAATALLVAGSYWRFGARDF